MLTRQTHISSDFASSTTAGAWNRLFVIKTNLTVLAYLSEAMAYVPTGNKLHAKP